MAASAYVDSLVDPLPPLTAADIETAQRIVEPVLTGIHEAGLYRMLLPRAFGGAELQPVRFFEVIEQLAKQDASVGWCLCQNNGCSMSAAWASGLILRWMIPIPPCRASAIARLASVTVSIAAERTGMLSCSLSWSAVCRSTCEGSTSA